MPRRYNVRTVIAKRTYVPAALLLLGLVAAASRAAAQAPRTQPAADADALRRDPVNAFVLGNVEYIVLHELAHVIIDDLQVPVIGPLEGAADYIATTVLIRADQFDPDAADRARNYLLATANGLATSWDVGLTTGREAQFWDTHALTIQRFYQIICLVYGSNPQAFQDLPKQLGMPAKRTAGCEQEFSRANRTLTWLLDNYGRGRNDPPGADVSLEFESPPTRVSASMASVIRASGMLNNTIRLLRERFALPQPLDIVFRTCHAPQANWLPAQREVVLCYELLDAYYLLGTDQRASDRRTILTDPP